MMSPKTISNIIYAKEQSKEKMRIAKLGKPRPQWVRTSIARAMIGNQNARKNKD